MAAQDSTMKRKHISKKNKSAWRKTDIEDVEQFLEDQRQEERVGTFTDKQNEDLFMVDSSPEKSAPSVQTVKQKRKLNALKPMRSHQALENTSKVQDPIVKRNHVRPMKNGRNIELEVCSPTKGRHRQANRDRGLYYEKLDQRLAARESGKKTSKIDKDIWQEEDFRDNIPGLKDKKGWISRDLAVHIAGNVGRKVVKTHASLHHKTTKAKKFEAPHPGMSYNPSLKAHLDLLAQVVDREEGIIKKEQHLKRVTTSMFSKVTPEERDSRRLQEMSEGIKADGDPQSETDNDEDDDRAQLAATDNAYQPINAPVENKKKSKQARSKELKQKELQRLHEAKKALKKQTADLIRIKSIRAELNEEAAELNEVKKRRKSKAERKKFETKRLGRHKFEAPDLDVNMADDLAGNLRNVKPESNLLTDRFKLMQKHNMLPTTVAVTRKRSKVKRFPRNSHKDPGVSFQDLRDQRKAAAAAAKANKDTIKI
ncbi:ribosome biogenesis protein NOP53 [Drosophila grimshawi]|uniref:Ribosome biogenesis protein NOP53 n=1 Tax=Drosophila grimshawi TaxID=7222 RepID=B4JJ53_DROGR|nr:ribosome biogenesis protein NOP53 [Drosophila grimshawi]EDV99605.1 GH12434 [Drosophila grimshawi]